jgi:tetratricopeptide (TPR) repeat protein
MGMAYSGKGDSEKAIGCYKESLDLESDQIATLMNLAVALKNVGREGEAETALAKAAKLTPTEPPELVELGKVWLKKEDPKKAMHFFKMALNHDKTSKEDIELYEGVILSLLEYGLVKETVPVIEVIAKDRPDLYNALGMAYVRPHVKGTTKQDADKEDFMKAVEAYTKCLELDVTGDRYAYLHNRGMAYYKADMKEEAEKDFIEAYNLYPNPATENMLNALGFDVTSLGSMG